jgi:hypothetical protein
MMSNAADVGVVELTEYLLQDPCMIGSGLALPHHFADRGDVTERLEVVPDYRAVWRPV